MLGVRFFRNRLKSTCFRRSCHAKVENTLRWSSSSEKKCKSNLTSSNISPPRILQRIRRNFRSPLSVSLIPSYNANKKSSVQAPFGELCVTSRNIHGDQPFRCHAHFSPPSVSSPAATADQCIYFAATVDVPPVPWKPKISTLLLLLPLLGNAKQKQEDHSTWSASRRNN